MMASAYLSDTGDLIWTDFDPDQGSGTGRPASGSGGFSCRIHREHRPGDRLSDHVARAAVPHQRRSAFDLADRGRDPDQPYPQHRHPGPANPLCRRRRVGRDRSVGPDEVHHLHHDLRQQTLPVGELVRLHREQRKAAAEPEQPALFELREDRRPAADCTAAGRYLGPSVFTLMER